MASSIAALTRKHIEPKPHQLETLEFVMGNKRLYNLSEMGTGKTLPAVLAANLLHVHSLVQRVLVIAPLSVIRATWLEHLEQFAEGVPLMLLDQSAKRKKLVKDLDSFNGVAIINPDGVESVFHQLRDWKPALVIIDELSGYYRNCRTNRWKALNLLLKLTNAATWAFTGTPLTKNLLDSYAQCLLVNPGNLPQKRSGGPVSFKQYRDMLCNQPYPNIWVPKPDALERVHSYMQPAVRYTRAEVMHTLAAAVRVRKDVPLSDEQRKMIDDFVARGRAHYGDKQVSAKEARAIAAKLTQITVGTVYDNQHNVIELPAAPRLQALVDLFDEVECTPIIVAAPFIHTIHRIERDLTGKGFRVAVIIGDVNPKERHEIVARFQNGQVDFLVCHPKTLAHGVTLTRSHTVCWYGPITDLELYAQLNDRISRYGQEAQPLIVELCSTPAELRMYNSLARKEQLSGKFLDLFGG